MTALPALDLGAALRSARAVLFDLFRTLTSVESTRTQAWPEPGEMLGFVDAPRARAWRVAWDEVAVDRIIGRIRTPREVLAIPARRVDATLPDALLDAAVAARQQKFDDALLRIAPDVLATLAALRGAGKRLALVSNADCMEAGAWPRSPLCPCFDAAIFSCDVGTAKPDPAIYLAACEALGVAPDECLFVGDGGSDELRGAAALGMTPVQMTGILDRHFPELVWWRARECRRVFASPRSRRWVHICRVCCGAAAKCAEERSRARASESIGPVTSANSAPTLDRTKLLTDSGPELTLWAVGTCAPGGPCDLASHACRGQTTQPTVLAPADWACAGLLAGGISYVIGMVPGDDRRVIRRLMLCPGPSGPQRRLLCGYASWWPGCYLSAYRAAIASVAPILR